MSVPFICECEGKSYAGWFNKKTCKKCNTIIHHKHGVQIGGYQWKTQRIKDLEDTIISICSFIESTAMKIGGLDAGGPGETEDLISLISKARKDVEDNQYRRR